MMILRHSSVHPPVKSLDVDGAGSKILLIAHLADIELYTTTKTNLTLLIRAARSFQKITK